MAFLRNFRRPEYVKRSYGAIGRKRRKKIHIRYASRRHVVTILVLVAAVAIFAGTFGYRYVPVLNSANISWGLYFRAPLEPPEAMPLGVELLQQHQGLYIADTNKKTVYFTFDLGYEAGYTSDTLNVLQAKNAHAIFFICGHYADKEDALVQRMLAEGHSVGNHTAKHKDPTTLSIAEMHKDILGLQQMFKEKYGADMRFYRPPGGKFNEQNLIVAQEYGLHPTLWSLAYTDWQRDKTIGKQAVLKIVMDRMHNGAVMLFHIVSSDLPDTLPDLIDTLRSQGYTIGEPQDLLTFIETSPAPAQ
ncbi:MAG: polysaccharide deacetylase family protein [Peptococcaceae bacterium]|jgi:peptidoglycan-N-acetylmuramic acid deacetylase|nr:polysaccharide deacetylase family protein [Peptococcaceae bacterium]MDR2736550.1 polysaccharide deacetylase family protein [Gracilibacteraceae bacterium]